MRFDILFHVCVVFGPLQGICRNDDNEIMVVEPGEDALDVVEEGCRVSGACRYQKTRTVVRKTK